MSYTPVSPIQPGAGKTALITGASGGIGCELAYLFARDAYRLALVARSEDKLRRLADELAARYGASVELIPADLADPSAPEVILHELAARQMTVDVLVNNAGFGTYGPFAETDWQAEQEMLQVNVNALTHLTKRLLPGMIERGYGQILNVASTAAFQPGPLMAVYYATKAYVLSFSEALAEELRGTGVTVTALCPGPTRSGFQARAGMERSRLVQGKLMDAATAAQIGYEGFKQKRAVVVPGAANRLLVQAVRFLPRAWVRRIVHRLQAE